MITITLWNINKFTGPLEIKLKQYTVILTHCTVNTKCVGQQDSTDKRGYSNDYEV